MSTLKDLARILVEKHKIKVGASEQFLQQMVEVINEGLLQDRIVKVKGFGTFKLQEVKERNSVNVNTGERVLIAAHDKIVFTPDNLMRDTINKPFAHFETVIMGDNMDIPAAPEDNHVGSEDIHVEQETTIAEPEQKTDALISKEIQETPETVVAEVAPLVVEPEATDVVEPVVTDVVEPEAITGQQNVEVAEKELLVDEPDQVYVDEEDDEEEKNTICHGNMMIYGAIMINILVAAIFFTLGYLASKNGWFESKEPVKVEIIDIAQKKTNVNPKKISDVKSAEEKQKPESSKVEQPSQPENPNAKYDYDARVRTGGYYILGTMEEVVVKKGQTLKGISKAYLGPDMECYVEVYNNKKEVKEGDKLLIPKLKPKHKFKK